MDLSKKAVVLLSGGVDSTTALAIAGDDGFSIYALSFDYGQRHHVELRAATQVAKTLKTIEHLTLKLDLGKIGGSALTDQIDVPKSTSQKSMDAGIPVTYVPARNTIFLSYALAWAEVLNAFDIFIGVTAIDYSGYPDCRPEYIASFEKMANLATKAGVEGEGEFKIQTPLIQLTKAQIIQKGLALGVDYSLTHSCYDPSPEGLACGKCDSCIYRQKGFQASGLTDPVPYIPD